MKRTSMSACLAAVALGCPVHVAAADLIVHEWGTFTSFQDADGTTIAGINVDDEPVPDFVHRLQGMPIFTPQSLPARWSQKGAPSCHPAVTLRLETPVLYFYPQSSFDRERTIDVSASFVGGWLTEFYPHARTNLGESPKPLGPATRGSLEWKNLQLPQDSTAANMPATKERVWLAPRKVTSAVVRRGEEAEKYLFYRGVGNLDAPLVVNQRGDSLTITARAGEASVVLPAMWLVRVTPDGRVLYQSVTLSGASTTIAISPDDGASDQSSALRGEIRATLRAQGLFDDEARAMLETWQVSYFESEGVRLFFVLPPAWTDAHLPLSISVPADITRVMLGRIELVSEHQRAVLQRMLELPDSAFDLRPLYLESPKVLASMEHGIRSHAAYYRMIGKPVPEALALYDSLGRFRDALLAHERRTTQDPLQRARLKVIMEKFSACELSGT